MNEEYVKRYDKWNERAKILDKRVFVDFYHEREIWWCSMGVNIGSEQDGRNDFFERPVIIVRKIRRNLLIVVPITSKFAEHQDRMTAHIAGQTSQILLSQVRSISCNRLSRKIGRIKTTIFRELIIRMIRILIDSETSETPLESGESRSPKAKVSKV